MPNYLIIRSYYDNKLVSVIITDDFMKHFLTFRDSEIKLQHNLYVALVPHNFNKDKELPQHLKFKCHNNNFYNKDILNHLPNNNNVITKKINIIIRYMRLMEKLINMRFKIDLDTDEIYIDYY